tara:strand:+ start:29 stop:1246 length:1218 start_codon:yes stop_codon:yes gene_type:complete
MFKQDNNLYVFVGSAFGNDVTTSAAATNEVHVVHEDGSASGNLASGDLFKISQKDADGNVRSTPLLAWNNLIKATGKATASSSIQEQEDVFGYNGSSGSIDAVNSNRYTIRVNFKDDDNLFSEQSDLHFFEYVSDAGAQQIEIVDYFAQVMSKHQKFSGKRSGKNRASVAVERFSAQSSTILGSSRTLTVTNGSDVVTASGASHNVAVGDYLRIGSATATTSPIYKVIAVSTNDFTLDQPYQGATDSGVAAGELDAVPTDDACGLKLTGIAQSWRLGLDPYRQIEFDTTLDGWGDTTAVATTVAATGDGYGKVIAELEWFSQGSAGAPYRHGVMPSNQDLITLVADKDDYYDVLEMQFDLGDPKHAIGSSGAGKVSVVIALPDGVASADGTQANATFGVSSIFHE